LMGKLNYHMSYFGDLQGVSSIHSNEFGILWLR
jgi:hypothetical protein